MKTTINGNAIVITSTLSMNDLHLVKKYRPDALKVMGGENGKDVLFQVVPVNSGSGAFSATCALLATGLDGKASVTITSGLEEFVGNTEGLKGYVADMVGTGKAYMEKLEAELPAVVEAIKSERQAIMDAITIGE